MNDVVVIRAKGAPTCLANLDWHGVNSILCVRKRATVPQRNLITALLPAGQSVINQTSGDHG